MERSLCVFAGRDADAAFIEGACKAAVKELRRKCDRAGFACDRFAWRNHVPDVVEINQSMEVRSGGEMRDAYRRSVEEMGGGPTRLHEESPPECSCWYRLCPKVRRRRLC